MDYQDMRDYEDMMRCNDLSDREMLDIKDKRIDVQKKEIERLKKALDEYGQHKDDCDFMKYRHSAVLECTCGFGQALKEK